MQTNSGAQRGANHAVSGRGANSGAKRGVSHSASRGVSSSRANRGASSGANSSAKPVVQAMLAATVQAEL